MGKRFMAILAGMRRNWHSDCFYKQRSKKLAREDFGEELSEMFALPLVILLIQRFGCVGASL